MEDRCVLARAKGFESDVDERYRKDSIKEEDHKLGSTNNVIM